MINSQDVHNMTKNYFLGKEKNYENFSWTKIKLITNKLNPSWKFVPLGLGFLEGDNYHVWPKQNNPDGKQI